MEWREVADQVFVRRHTALDLNIGLVIGDGACLVVDTRTSLVAGRELAESVRRVTSAPWTVVITHAHFDHCFGNAAFLPADIWGQVRCAQAVRDGGEHTRTRIADRYRDAGQEQEARDIEATPLHAPNRLITDEVTLDIGGRAVQVRYLGRGHTDHDLVLLVDDVLLAGDLVEEGAPPQFRDAYPLDWPETLDALLAMASGPVVPGHGDVVDAAFVRGQREDLAHVVELARQGHAEGKPVAEVAARLPRMGEFAGQAVERAYLQLSP